MPTIRIISDPKDSSPHPATRTIKDALSKLAKEGELPADSKLTLLARSPPERPASSAALLFRSSRGDMALFALPISRGCWVTGTFGVQRYMTLDRLDGAEVDDEGNVRLRDGTYVHAVSFDLLSLHFELPELEQVIVFLTILYLKAEAQCLQINYGILVGVDYSAVRDLRVPSVKALTRYINENIGRIRRRNGGPPFNNISIATVQRTLDLVHIQKVRGRPKKTSAPATERTQSNTGT